MRTSLSQTVSHSEDYLGDEGQVYHKQYHTQKNLGDEDKFITNYHTQKTI